MSVSNQQLMDAMETHREETSEEIKGLSTALRIVSDEQIKMGANVANMNGDMEERKGVDEQQWKEITKQGKDLKGVSVLQQESQKRSAVSGGVSGGATGGIVAAIAAAIAWVITKLMGT